MTELEGWVDVPGGRIWAQAAGEGQGVVLVHTGITDARMWDPQWPALAAGYRVARYDTREFGRTESDAVDYSDVADLIAVMDAAGMDRATLVGGSRGGRIALDAVLERPDRVTGLVWVCGGIGGLAIPDTPEIEALGEREDALEAARDWSALADFDVALWVDGFGQREGRAAEDVRRFVHQMAYETYVQEKPEGRAIPIDPPAIERLDEIHVPLLAIVGELDLETVSIAADRLVAGVAGARRVDVPGAAHLPSLEQPAWFTETLLEFLAGVV